MKNQREKELGVCQAKRARCDAAVTSTQKRNSGAAQRRDHAVALTASNYRGQTYRSQNKGTYMYDRKAFS